VEYGGSDEHVILVLVLRCLSDSLALMVTDAKGRITFANSQLATLLGYNARTLTDGMNMSSLLPPPYAQIHGSFMKVGVGSCVCWGGGRQPTWGGAAFQLGLYLGLLLLFAEQHSKGSTWWYCC
jgi:hypothetical protein